MILIADAGSTKSAWALLEGEQGRELTFVTPGINAATMSPRAIADLIEAHLLPQIAGRHIDEIHFYGAGVISGQHAAVIADALAPVGATTVAAGSDMLGAARALLGRDAGIACILGTGSNSCLYDGERIADNVPALGYILGDEGSGASLGRRLIGDLFKRLLPEEIAADWRERYGLTMADVIERVYRQPGANAFLASFAPFIAAHIDNRAVGALVDDEFDRFFERNVMAYDCPERRIGFAGSVACHFRQPLERAAARHGYYVSSILASPLPSLINYHRKN